MSFSVSKFSRWLRALCTILLSRNNPTDRTKSLGYVEQAVAVIEDHSAAVDQNEVLFHPAYHTTPLHYSPDISRGRAALASGNRVQYRNRMLAVSAWLSHPGAIRPCFHSASQIDEAKRWFESCTIICRHVPNGEARAEKVTRLSSSCRGRFTWYLQISDTYSQLLAHYAPGNTGEI